MIGKLTDQQTCSCGATWQVEIGKWEAHFSLPSTEQKIKAFSSTEAMERGREEVEHKVSNWLNNYHQVYMLVFSGLAGRVSTIDDGRDWMGHMSYLFVLGHIYLCGIREAWGIEMVCQ